MENNGGDRGPPDDRNKQPKNVGKLLHMCLEAQSSGQQDENHVVQPMPEEVNMRVYYTYLYDHDGLKYCENDQEFLSA